jgi:hypothetical protein
MGTPIQVIITFIIRQLTIAAETDVKLFPSHPLNCLVGYGGDSALVAGHGTHYINDCHLFIAMQRLSMISCEITAKNSYS